MRRAASAAAVLAVAAITLSAQSDPFEFSARAILKELVEINTTESSGGTTLAAEAMAARLRAAGFQREECRTGIAFFQSADQRLPAFGCKRHHATFGQGIQGGADRPAIRLTAMHPDNSISAEDRSYEPVIIQLDLAYPLCW